MLFSVNPDTYEGTNRNPGDVWGGGSDKDSNRGGGSSSSSNTSTTFFAKSGTMAGKSTTPVFGTTKTSAISTYAQSRFASVVLDGVVS